MKKGKWSINKFKFKHVYHNLSFFRCLADYIDILTSGNYNIKRLIGRYCGSNLPSTFHSMYPKLEIIFQTSHITGHNGFYGMYQFLNES